MGYIAEPKGIDFLIKSPPLTGEERKALSEFIQMRKKESRKKSVLKQKSRAKEKQKT